MGCCVGEKHNNWCEEYGIVYIDAEGKEYCIFHAPADCKFVKFYDERKGGEKPALMDAEQFNGMVFERIDAVIEAGVDEERDKFDFSNWNPRCNFSGTIFPYSISFNEYDGQNDKYLPPINFISSQFSGDADFRSSQFSKNAYFISSQFSGDADFSSSQFSGDADFRSSQFSKNAYFISSQFSGDADFSSSQFSGDADFRSSQFSKNAYFISSQFSGDADFRSSQFSKNAYFISSQFSGDADFRSSQFSKNAYFISSQFSGDADFRSSQFSGDADFRSSQFSKNAYFISSQFSGDADFSSSQFSGDADFRSSQFSKNAYFISSQFSGDADFRSSQFSKNAYFISSQFSGDADFRSSQFSGDADFRSSQFSKNADFNNAEIQKQAKFTDVKFVKSSFDQMEFKGPVYFDNSIFEKEASFRNAIFHEYSNFEQTKFNNSVSFRHALFKEWSYFRNVEFNGETSFAGAISKETIVVENVDLSNFYFAETNIESFKFTECTWPRKENGRRTIADEISPRESSKGLSFTKLEEIYRRLKKVARENNDEMQASTWHYNEKEMLRKKMREENGPGIIEKLGTKTCELLPCNIEIAKTKLSKLIETSEQKRTPFLRFINTTYWIVSGYGEEPLRAGIWLLILIFGAMILACFGPDSNPPSDFITKWMWYMPLIKVNLSADGLHYLLKGLSVTLITLQAALFGFALRNKLRR
ncbi:pentapeptide repeat-containing protein [Maridesulfovibrio sp.]|uniref:pentapeptide repeat-containing protein n=1 Tax=Maridesulfovibrio sp. TaxID=2795000 RepID=UPI0039F124A7